MTRVLVNNQPQTADLAAKTWGDLLEALDAASAGRGHVVTAARLDGVDEPSFRHPDVCARALDRLALVEVETDTPAALVADTMQEAATALDGLRRHAVDVAGRFRGHDIQSAQEGLLQLVQGLQMITSVVTTVGVVLQQDMSALLCGDEPIGVRLDRVGAHLEALVEAQQAGDWLTVGDILEYDIEPALGACRPLFELVGGEVTRPQ